MISPLILVINLSEFITSISTLSSVVGIGMAISIDYIYGRLTDSGRQWPKLPVWTNSPYLFIVSFVVIIVAFVSSFFPAPSWAPAVAIGGMYVFATASATTIILGSIRSAVWVVRQTF